MEVPDVEIQDLLSAALDESGIKPEDVSSTTTMNSTATSNTSSAATAAVSSETSIASSPGAVNYQYQNGPRNIHPSMGAYGHMPWNPYGFQYPQMGPESFPYFNKNMMEMMGPEFLATMAAYQHYYANNGVQIPPGMAPKDFTSFLINGDAMFRGIVPHESLQNAAAPEDAEEEEEELGHAETYAEYMPSKLKIGQRHPDPVVETSSLSSVPPPDIWYKLSIPEETIDRRQLSALQLEAIVYACQQHETLLPDGSRAGFLIGDGAGVGKGRTLAGLIHENYLLGRKRALWLSVSNDLKYDSVRDLKDIGAGKIDVHSLHKFKYAKISSKVNGSVKKGVIFATYSALIGESQSGGKYRSRLKQLLHWCGEDFDGVIVFDECHKAKNLCPVGSSKPTKTGLTVLELQNKLPKARVVYASATGASEPKNMAYMTRLGLWGEGTPFREFTDFISVVEKRGVGAMELVAMDMKLRGLYMARQLSFAGVSFKIEEIPLCPKFIDMYDDAVSLWVDARSKFHEAAELMEGDPRTKKTMWCQFWASHQRFFKYLCIASKVKHAVTLSREAVKDGKCVVIGLQSTGEQRTLEQLEESGGELTDFVSTAKAVFQSLIEKHFPAPNRKKMLKLLGLNTILNEHSPSGSPTPTTSSGGKRKPLRQARQGVKRYRECQLSDESSSEEYFDNNTGSDFDPSGLDSGDEVHSDDDFNPSEESGDSDFNPFGDDSDSDDPWLSRKSKSKSSKHKDKKKSSYKKIEKTIIKPPPVDAVEKAANMKDEILKKLDKLQDRLPPNTLDQLIDDLGGPENVAEMTGRKGRVVSNDDGSIQYESRSESDVPLETLNMTEKSRFMNGDKHIAIISEAASSGISLQSDRRVKNQARRVHLTLELPWSADRAIQQFGRTHRSNQVSAPEYVFLISDLAGERRFAATVAKRLESLGALTHGDRRASESRDLSRFNIDNKYGRSALESVMRAVMGYETPLVQPPVEYKGDFFGDVRKSLIGVGIVFEDEKNGYLSLDKDYNNISKFLNRILGIKVELQNRLFHYFTETLEAVIQQAKKTGRWDMGILDLGTAGDQVTRVKCNCFIRRHVTGTAKTELHTVRVERGMSWEAASDLWAELTGTDEGFYISSQTRNNKKTAVLAVADSARRRDKKDKDKTFRIYRPNTGLQARQESLGELKAKYKKVSNEEAETHWKENYEAAAKVCSHVYWYGHCKKETVGIQCEIGLRQRTYYVLSGSVLSVWTKVESVLASVPSTHNAKLQVVRLRTQDDVRIVGSLIPSSCIPPLITVLSQDATKTYEEEF